jgi:hypothetical protein
MNEKIDERRKKNVHNELRGNEKKKDNTAHDTPFLQFEDFHSVIQKKN